MAVVFANVGTPPARELPSRRPVRNGITATNNPVLTIRPSNDFNPTNEGTEPLQWLIF